MTNEPIPDLSAHFQAWVTKLEREFNEYANKVMGTDGFSKSINRMQGLQLEFQRMFGEFMSKQLANFNMPSRDDLTRIGEDLRNLNRRMAHIERSLEKLATGDDPPLRQPSGPARTRKPPSTKS